MVGSDISLYHKSQMKDSDFMRLSSFIYTNYGIKLPPSKKLMLESRLRKRLKALEILSFKDYCDYLFSAEGKRQELIDMIDAVTTNKTDFFREAAHFDFLKNRLLPEYYRGIVDTKPLKVWSAGCSSGEEPYTLAMVLSEFSALNNQSDFNILGTDISSHVLETAVKAVYSEDKIAPVPLAYKRKYLLKSKDVQNKTVRIVPELREKVSFQRLNFIDGDLGRYPVFNIIFCRNVLIYFDKPTQEKVILKLCSKLKSGGFLFLGHSESVSHMELPLEQVRPTVFRKI